MPVTKHDVYHEFPEHQGDIQKLLNSSTHFSALVDRYHAVDKVVHEMEESSPFGVNGECEPYKRQRLKLKDQLYSYLTED